MSTPETPTPETDAAARRGAYIKAPSLYYETHGKQLVHIDDARKLERERDAARAENAAMRAAIREAHVFITRLKKQELEKDFDDYVSSYGVSQAFATSENACTEILTKLQPYLSDATPTKP